MCDAPKEDINNCLADCPGVQTSDMCGEEPHSDRGGRTLSFGVGHRAKSAQDCCDKCAAHSKQAMTGKAGCNSWTFCGYPVCWGLDTGWNHTVRTLSRRRYDTPFRTHLALIHIRGSTFVCACCRCARSLESAGFVG